MSQKSHDTSTSVITSLDDLQQLSPEWTSLWNRCPGATSFQRPEWVLSWAKAFRPHEIFTIECRRDGVLVGLAPLFRYSSASKHVLAPLAASISDYLDWLIQPAYAGEVIAKILNVLSDAPFTWDRLEITDLPSTSLLLKAVPDMWEAERAVETVCPVLSIPSRARSVEDILGSKQRHNLRTARNRTANAGKARVEIADACTLDQFVEAMMRLHGKRWAQYDSPGMLADNAVQEFHRLASRALLQAGVLKLYGLRLDDVLIATLYALVESDVVYCYLQGFDPAYKALSPGAQILAAVIDDAVREAKASVDFLRGREPYKYVWGAADRDTYRLCLCRTGLKKSSALAPAA